MRRSECMKLSYKRLGVILEFLLNNSANRYVSASFLAQKCNVSTRTIRSDIQALNRELSSLQVEIKNKRGEGFYLSDFDKKTEQKLTELARSDLPASSSGERIAEVEQYLLVNSRVKLDDLTEKLFISDNTFFTYLVTIKKEFSDFGLRVVKDGDEYYVDGSESAKRNFIISKLINKKSNSYIVDFTEREKSIFANLDLNLLKETVHGFLRHYSYHLSDINTKNIILHLALAISRIKMGYRLETGNSVEIKPPVQRAVQKLLQKLEAEFQVEFNQVESNDLIYHFALNYPECVSENDHVSIKDNINSAITIFLENIKKEFAIDLLDDRELRVNLTQHLTNLVKIKTVNGNRKNPLLNVILSTFPYAYEITAYSAPILEHMLNLKLNDDELSFITLHIGASIERQGNLSSQKNAALICGNGISTAALVRAKLQTQFASFLNITGTYTYDEYLAGKASGNDFLISMVPLTDAKVPVIQIDLTNFHNDILQLSEYLKSLNNPYRAINKLFDEENIYLVQEPLSKAQLLDMLIKNLERKKIVNKDFKQRVDEREKMYSTAIGGKIAIPHSLGYATKKSKVSFARLDKPIKWDEKNEVKYVFLLAIARQDYLSVQKLFDFIVDLQTNLTFRKIIDKSSSSKEIKHAISSLIKSSY